MQSHLIIWMAEACIRAYTELKNVDWYIMYYTAWVCTSLLQIEHFHYPRYMIIYKIFYVLWP